MKMKRVLFVPDCHHPYVDAVGWSVMMKAAVKFQPDVLIILGDFVDCYTVSQYTKRPGRIRHLKDEIATANLALDELDGLCPSEKYFLEGNHEKRLPDFVATKCPELEGLLSIDKLLRLKTRGYHITPYMNYLRLGKLNICHGIRIGETANIRTRQEFCGNVVHGHTHWMGVNYRGTAQGDAHVGAAFGWLGDVDHIDYTHRVDALRWQLGFGVGYLESSGIIHLQAIPIVKGRCVLNGCLIK